MLPICKAFVCLPFYKRSFHIPLQSPWGGTRPLSVSSSNILSFIQTYSILLSTIRQQRPGCPQYGNQRFLNSIDLQPMTTSYCRHSPYLSREENVLHAFLRANIQELTFHQTNYCSSPQTIRRQAGSLCGFLSDFRGRTSACFPVSWYASINQLSPS